MSGNIFNKIQLTRPKHSWFDMSYDHKLSFKMGKLIPIHLQEAIPGDKFCISTEAMFRMMPMISPIMHKVDIYVHHFYVPNRLLWPGWESFITGGENVDTTIPAFPILKYDEIDVTPSTLADYLGLPLGDYSNVIGEDPMVSALPFAAYQRIWAEYYRDQNLDTGAIDYSHFQVGNGVQNTATTDFLLSLRDRAWEHDYFTSCLPFAQKGDLVEMPFEFSGTAPVINTPSGNPIKLVDPVTGGNFPGGGDPLYTTFADELTSAGASSYLAAMDPQGSLGADMDNISTSTTINDLRTAFSLQKWLEKNARAGSRYIENILGHFGVRSSDKRLDRPEYIGGSKASMAISEVLQTSQSDTSPQGTMAGHGIGITGGKQCEFFCEEHGYVMSILSIRPRTAYQQGLPRHFSKYDRLEYYWPDFAHLGEQSVRNQEICLRFGNTGNRDTFGYIPRYSEYRYNSSRVSGQMKDTLDFWHMGRIFDTTVDFPALNAEFIKCDPTKRIFAVTDPDEDEIVGHIFHKIMARRPLPQFGNPGSL